MMYTFQVLGTVDLRGPDGRRIGSLLSQPKRLALLVVLAIEAPRRLQRDEVMGLLWPEMSEDRARNALRQALHYLRRSLGPGVIAGKGAEGIGIVPGKLSCDASELLAAVEAGRHRAVLEVYGGSLLPGFHLDGGPVAFERWLDDARRRIQRAAAESARTVAKEAEAAGEVVAAGVAARKAWELADWGEPALQELLGVLIRTGDVSGARDAYAEFTDRLREEHGAEPSAATRSLLERLDSPAPAAAEASTVRAPTAPAESADRETEEAKEPWKGVEAAVAAPPGTKAAATSRIRSRAWWPALAAVLAVCVVGIWALLPRAEESVLEAAMFVGSESPSLYLEPVRDLEATGGYPRMAEAATTELAARLSETNGFLVVALSEGKEPASAHGIRLRPTLREVGGEVQLSVLLLDPASDAVLEQLTVRMADASKATAEALAGQMAPRIRRAAGEVLSMRGLLDRGIRAEALDAVRKAARELDAANELRIRGAWESAGLAYEGTDSLLSKAAELERGWSEPPLRRAQLRLKSMWLHLIPPHDRREVAHEVILEGVAHAESALAIAPDHAMAGEVRGVLLYWAGQTAPDAERRRAFTRDSEAALEWAVDQDDGLARAWSILSALAEARGDFGTAYHRARKAYVADFDLRSRTDNMVRLFTNALEAGDPEGAVEWCAEIRRRQSDHWIGPYCELTHLAWVGPWDAAGGVALLDEGLASVPEGPAGAEARARLMALHAVVLAKAGENEAAREVLASVEGSGPASLELLDLQAWARTALGETGRARQLLAAAAEMAPDLAPRVLRSRRYDGLSAYALVRNDE